MVKRLAQVDMHRRAWEAPDPVRLRMLGKRGLVASLCFFPDEPCWASPDIFTLAEPPYIETLIPFEDATS